MFSTWQADNHRQMFRLSDSKMNLEFPSGQPLVSSPVIIIIMIIIIITRWVDGTPTTEVTPVTIWWIHTPDLGYQMVMIMVMNHPLPLPLCNVNRPSYSEIQLFQNLTMKIHGQGHVCGQSSRSHLTFKIQRSSSNPLVTFEAWISVDMFAFRFMAIRPLLAEI